MTNSARAPANGASSARLEQRLWERFAELWDDWVDPREPYADSDGLNWLPLTGSGAGSDVGPTSEVELRRIRQECRALALSNEFAINGHENRISYLVGTGHAYRAVLRKGSAAPLEWVAAVQHVVERFLRENRWQQRQQECVRRCDRDGEAFLRFFPAADGLLRVRFVEPGQISTPPALSGDASASLGILTEPLDVETVLAYYIDGQSVPADEVQHRKANVDANVKRGLPLYFPVRKNLRRAEKLLRNMSVVAEIQSAIALIRKHQAGTLASVQQFVVQQAQAAAPAASGKQLFRYGPGTILDAPSGVEYDFPAARLEAASFVAILQAELRAIAARLVMPEFMLSADASNANYASTMVAEGPAVKHFARLQAELIEYDLQVLARAVQTAVQAGKLPEEVLTEVEITAAGPPLGVRDALRDAQVARVQAEAGILSPQTWSQRAGLDYAQEQAQLRQHRAAKQTAE